MARGAPGVGRAAVPKSAHSRRVGSHVGLFRSEISCRRVPRRVGRLRRTQRVGVHAEAPRRTGVGRLVEFLARAPSERLHASARALSLCVCRRRRGDVGRLGGGSASGHSPWPGSRAGRWDNAPYWRRGNRRAPGTSAPPVWSPPVRPWRVVMRTSRIWYTSRQGTRWLWDGRT